MKFEEALYVNKGLKKLVSIDVISKIRKDNPIKFRDEIQGYLYCPECHSPQLIHRQCVGKSDHFATSKDQKHKDECSSLYEKANQKIISEILSEPNHEKLKNRLQYFLMSLHKPIKLKSNPLIYKKTKISKVNTDKKEVNNIVIKSYYLPRKRLTNKLLPDDVEDTKIFYGDVLIKWRSLPDEKHLLLIHNLQSQYICSLFMSKNVYNYIDNNFKIDMKCSVAFIAKLNAKEQNEKIFYNANLNHSSEIEFMKL